jgi:nucleotide-binding universal stress UspA family protein
MTEIKRIIVGVDGSESSKAALEWAYNEAAHHDAAITVIAVWQPPTMPLTPPYGSLPPEGYEGQPRTNALNLLEQSVRNLEPRTPVVDVRTLVEEGNPAEVLIEQSKEADLLVVGSRGLGGFRGMLLGSISQHVVAHAACPVVVLR